MHCRAPYHSCQPNEASKPLKSRLVSRAIDGVFPKYVRFFEVAMEPAQSRLFPNSPVYSAIRNSKAQFAEETGVFGNCPKSRLLVITQLGFRERFLRSAYRKQLFHALIEAIFYLFDILCGRTNQKHGHRLPPPVNPEIRHRPQTNLCSLSVSRLGKNCELCNSFEHSLPNR